MSRRFERQTRFAPLGAKGQAQLEAARVLVVGTGALGGAIAQLLARSGVGQLVLVDRDIVEESNLPRQLLFEDRHAAEGRPKVLAAAQTLARIGGPTRIETHAVHLDADNLPDLATGCDLILDGTDNMPTRYLLNDLAVERDLPWVYGGVVGGAGLVLAIRPGQGPCLRCIFRDPPPPGTLPTCDTAGVIAPAVGAIAALQAGLGLRLLVDPEGLEPALVELDAWSGETRRIVARQDPACPCCVLGERKWLDAPESQQAVSLCGRNTVQVRGSGRPDLDRLAERLGDLAPDLVRVGPVLRATLDDVRMTLFPDGRALLEGTEDLERARAFYDRYVGT